MNKELQKLFKQAIFTDIKMIKEDIIKSIYNELGNIDREASKDIVEQIISEIKDTLKKEENLMISGFGQFKINRKKERVGRNPKTKEEYNISERNVVTFYPSRVFRQEINSDLM